MEKGDIVKSLGALAHPTRLDVFRLLVQAGAGGVAAGAIAQETQSLSNTLSANLNILTHAGLIRSQRQGRSVRYFANYDQMAELLGYLIADCCSRSEQICGPLLAALDTAACRPTDARKETA